MAGICPWSVSYQLPFSQLSHPKPAFASVPAQRLCQVCCHPRVQQRYIQTRGPTSAV